MGLVLRRRDPAHRPAPEDSEACGGDEAEAVDESPEESTEVRAQSRAEQTVHQRILARRESVRLEGKMALRQMITWAAGGVLLGAGLVALVFFSPLLAVRNVEVVGAVHEGVSDVESAAAVPDDATLAEIPVRSVASGVETLPWVKRAEVSRRLPWTVRIRVIERSPVAVADSAGTRGLVDEEGVVLEHVAPGGDTGSLPTITGTVPLPDAGGLWADEVGVPLLSAAAELPADLVPLIATVTIDAGHLHAVLNDGTPVRFGPPEDVSHKSAVLMAVLEDLARRQVGVVAIDVSAADSPAVVPAGTPE